MADSVATTDETTRMEATNTHTVTKTVHESEGLCIVGARVMSESGKVESSVEFPLVTSSNPTNTESTHSSSQDAVHTATPEKEEHTVSSFEAAHTKSSMESVVRLEPLLDEGSVQEGTEIHQGALQTSTQTHQAQTLSQTQTIQSSTQETQAIGQESQAIGQESQAIGQESQAIGQESQAIGQESQAIGQESQAIQETQAIGHSEIQQSEAISQSESQQSEAISQSVQSEVGASQSDQSASQPVAEVVQSEPQVLLVDENANIQQEQPTEPQSEVPVEPPVVEPAVEEPAVEEPAPVEPPVVVAEPEPVVETMEPEPEPVVVEPVVVPETEIEPQKVEEPQVDQTPIEPIEPQPTVEPQVQPVETAPVPEFTAAENPAVSEDNSGGAEIEQENIRTQLHEIITEIEQTVLPEQQQQQQEQQEVERKREEEEEEGERAMEEVEYYDEDGVLHHTWKPKGKYEIKSTPIQYEDVVPITVPDVKLTEKQVPKPQPPPPQPQPEPRPQPTINVNEAMTNGGLSPSQMSPIEIPEGIPLLARILPKDDAREDGNKISLERLFTPATDSGDLTPKKKKAYASSSFYRPDHPTIDDQVELAQRISFSLVDENNKLSRGQSMYMKRKKRASRWIHQGLDMDDEHTGGGSGTEGHDEDSPPHAPLVQHQEPLTPIEDDSKKPAMKLLMNPKGVQDFHAVQQHYQNLMETAVPTSPEINKIVSEVQSPTGKGAELFAKRKKRMDKFIVDETTVQKAQQHSTVSQQQTFNSTTNMSSSSTTTFGAKKQAEIERKKQQDQIMDEFMKNRESSVTLVKSPWQAALETGCAATAFEDNRYKAQIPGIKMFQNGKPELANTVCDIADSKTAPWLEMPKPVPVSAPPFEVTPAGSLNLPDLTTFLTKPTSDQPTPQPTKPNPLNKPNSVSVKPTKPTPISVKPTPQFNKPNPQFNKPTPQFNKPTPVNKPTSQFNKPTPDITTAAPVSVKPNFVNKPTPQFNKPTTDTNKPTLVSVKPAHVDKPTLDTNKPTFVSVKPTFINKPIHTFDKPTHENITHLTTKSTLGSCSTFLIKESTKSGPSTSSPSLSNTKSTPSKSTPPSTFSTTPSAAKTSITGGGNWGQTAAASSTQEKPGRSSAPLLHNLTTSQTSSQASHMAHNPTVESDIQKPSKPVLRTLAKSASPLATALFSQQQQSPIPKQQSPVFYPKPLAHDSSQSMSSSLETDSNASKNPPQHRREKSLSFQPFEVFPHPRAHVEGKAKVTAQSSNNSCISPSVHQSSFLSKPGPTNSEGKITSSVITSSQPSEVFPHPRAHVEEKANTSVPSFNNSHPLSSVHQPSSLPNPGPINSDENISSSIASDHTPSSPSNTKFPLITPSLSSPVHDTPENEPMLKPGTPPLFFHPDGSLVSDMRDYETNYANKIKVEDVEEKSKELPTVITDPHIVKKKCDLGTFSPSNLGSFLAEEKSKLEQTELKTEYIDENVVKKKRDAGKLADFGSFLNELELLCGNPKNNTGNRDILQTSPKPTRPTSLPIISLSSLVNSPSSHSPIPACSTISLQHSPSPLNPLPPTPSVTTTELPSIPLQPHNLFPTSSNTPTKLPSSIPLQPSNTSVVPPVATYIPDIPSYVHAAASHSLSSMPSVPTSTFIPFASSPVSDLPSSVHPHSLPSESLPSSTFCLGTFPKVSEACEPAKMVQGADVCPDVTSFPLMGPLPRSYSPVLKDTEPKLKETPDPSFIKNSEMSLSSSGIKSEVIVSSSEIKFDETAISSMISRSSINTEVRNMSMNEETEISSEATKSNKSVDEREMEEDIQFAIKTESRKRSLDEEALQQFVKDMEQSLMSDPPTLAATTVHDLKPPEFYRSVSRTSVNEELQDTEIFINDADGEGNILGINEDNDREKNDDRTVYDMTSKKEHDIENNEGKQNGANINEDPELFFNVAVSQKITEENQSSSNSVSDVDFKTSETLLGVDSHGSEITEVTTYPEIKIHKASIDEGTESNIIAESKICRGEIMMQKKVSSTEEEMDIKLCEMAGKKEVFAEIHDLEDDGELEDMVDEEEDELKYDSSDDEKDECAEGEDLSPNLPLKSPWAQRGRLTFVGKSSCFTPPPFFTPSPLFSPSTNPPTPSSTGPADFYTAEVKVVQRSSLPPTPVPETPQHSLHDFINEDKADKRKSACFNLAAKGWGTYNNFYTPVSFATS